MNFVIGFEMRNIGGLPTVKANKSKKSLLKYHLLYKEAYYYNIVEERMNDISGFVNNESHVQLI